MASDLLLLAVRYISGDLPDDATAAFEARLANDQSAREAVARAVELAGAVAQLPPETVDVLPLARPGLRRAIGLAAAACLAIGAGVALWLHRDDRPSGATPPVVAAPSHPQAVALAWSGLRQSGEIDTASHTELLAWLDDPVGSAVLDVLGSDTPGTEEDGLPAWLLEATSLSGTREN